MGASTSSRLGVAALLIGLAACAFRSPALGQTTELLFYTSVPRDLSDPLAQKFMEMNPSIKLNLFQAGAETVLQKMQLEARGAGRFQADVVWLEEPAAIEKFADDGKLEPYASPELSHILPAYRDKDGRFVADHLSLVMIMYNTRKLDAKLAPTSWNDLRDKRFAGQLIFSNPRVSGAGAIFAGVMIQNFGWSYWEDIAKLQPLLVAGSQGMTSTLVQGERTLGPMQDYSIRGTMQQGQPIAYVIPKEGAVAVPAYVAIIKGTTKLEAAKKFYDFMISKDAANIMLGLGMDHTRTDMPGPAGWPSPGETKTLQFDWAAFGTAKAAIQDKFSDLMER